MCGRYGLNHPHPVLTDWYRDSFMPELMPRYNIAPTMDILAMRETERRPHRFDRCAGDLIPYWAKETKKLPVMNNARAETVAAKDHVQAVLPPAAMPDPRFRIFRVENGGQAQAAVLYIQPGRYAIFICRHMGNLDGRYGRVHR